jgi:hypothetical protein
MIKVSPNKVPPKKQKGGIFFFAVTYLRRLMIDEVACPYGWTFFQLKRISRNIALTISRLK